MNLRTSYHTKILMSANTIPWKNYQYSNMVVTVRILVLLDLFLDPIKRIACPIIDNALKVYLTSFCFLKNSPTEDDTSGGARSR